MSAKDSTTQVWLFSELAKNKPAKGKPDYPVAIKASHLDENWRRTTLKQPKETDPAAALYEVAYEEDGTYITRILPSGTNVGDLLYWNGQRWTPLAAVSSSTLHILGIQNGALQWVATQDCE